MRWLLLALALFVQPALAQPIQVSTGEHGDFTRLVLRVPPGADWTLGRTLEGYALELGSGGSDFDLSRAFDRIDRSRISDLRNVDGRLQLDVGCACHAIPFAFRSDMLVIDIRDGAPPPGSSFELGLAGAPLLPLSTDAPRSDGSPAGPVTTLPVWTDLWRDQRNSPILPSSRPEVDSFSQETASFRDALLMEFSRAAADGLIEPAETMPDRMQTDQRSGGPGGNLRIGDGLTARPATRDPLALAADGATCPAPDSLAIQDWADDRPPAQQFAEVSQTLLGEFDAPNPDAILRAVRLNLHFGFGAEAGLMMASYPLGGPQSVLLKSLSRLVDGQPDPAGPFPALAACDGAAALWAALSVPGKMPVNLNRPAALRAFSGLPPHLRRSLGPTLADAFLSADDVASATTVVEAILRLPGKPDDATQILAARLSLVVDAGVDAQQRLEEILADPGPSQSSALVALVDLHARDGRPIDPRVVTALAAYREENAGTVAEAALLRAEVLATALTGDFGSAFANAGAQGHTVADLWRLLSNAADDQLILTAIGAHPASADAATRTRISERLASLGFLDEAQRWAPSSAPLIRPPPSPDPLRDAIVARDWQSLPPETPDLWAEAAATLRSSPESDLPPLAQAEVLAEQSARTRAALDALLDGTAAP